jgi:hypothetical protein
MSIPACIPNHQLNSIQLHSILEYRNAKVNERFANKAQQSSDNMHMLTTQMHEIAQQTRREAVSMRIITLVTLFFLPGTFVAVREIHSPWQLNYWDASQTFMSTDILRWTDAGRVFQLSALRTYLGISLPLMATTFAAWYLLYKMAARKDARDEKDNIQKPV